MRKFVAMVAMGVSFTAVQGCASSSDELGLEEGENLGETAEAFAGRWDSFFDGEVPDDVVERGTRQVCAAFHGGAWHPGKLADFRCFYGYGGREWSTYSYKALHAEPGFVWLPSSRGVPADRVFGPINAEGRSYAVCSVKAASGEFSLGKVFRGECHHGWAGGEERRSDFDYLANVVCSPTPVHPICETGAPLPRACDPCVTTICTIDRFCCETLWDGACVREVSSECGGTCL